MSVATSQTPVRLPPELQLGEQIGKGRRSWVYRASLHGQDVALKLYRPEAAAKHWRRYQRSIARFEHERNAAFYRVEALRPFVAKPLGVLGEHDGCDTAFVQQLVEGTLLREVARERGCIPPETLDAMRHIVELAGRAGLYDIDLGPGNMFVRRTERGWMPLIFDFNMVPQHVHAPNPWVAFLYWTGIRHPAHRDRLMLKKLQTWKC